MWRFGRYSERKMRKSPFSTTPPSFDAPSPANPREYLHKPYIARNYVPGAAFYMGSSANFRTVLSESRRRQPIAEPEIDFNAIWPFKIIQGHLFGLTEEPPRGYIAQCNKCGLRCMWRFGRYSERKKRKSPFSTTRLSFDVRSPANPREYLHKAYLARN